MKTNCVYSITRHGGKSKFCGLVIAMCFIISVFNPVSAREKRLDFVNAKTWNTVEHPNNFPETDDPEIAVPWLKDRKSFGIAFSGGGTRSASATLGQLRALHQLGWLKKAKYISANSGGSWASVPYTFLPTSISDVKFLGKYIPPENITDSELTRSYNATEKSSLSYAISNTELSKEQLIKTLSKGDEGYARIVGRWFLEPFKPNDKTKFFTFHKAARDAALLRNSEKDASGYFLKPEDFYLAKNSRPYLVINATLIASDKKDAVKERALYPVEITPIYTGVRRRFTTKSNADPDAPRMIGGGYVESFGYDSNPPADSGSDDEVKAKLVCRSKLKLGKKSNKRYRFTLADVIASSGAAPAETLVEKLSTNLVFSEFRHWAVHERPPYAEKDCSDDLEFPHGDGGHTDNVALIPLLVRQVKNILVFINTRNELCGDGEVGIPKCKKVTAASCAEQPELSAGCVPNGFMNDALVSYFRQTTEKPYNVVFENGDSRLHTLYNKFKKQKKAGKPLVHCENYSVIENQRYSVSSYQTNICWVYLDAPKDWIESIPDSIVNNSAVQQLKEKTGKHFSHFPFYLTFKENPPQLVDLSPEQVRALSNLTTWTVMQSVGVISRNLNTAGLTD